MAATEDGYKTFENISGSKNALRKIREDSLLSKIARSQQPMFFST